LSIRDRKNNPCLARYLSSKKGETQKQEKMFQSFYVGDVWAVYCRFTNLKSVINKLIARLEDEISLQEKKGIGFIYTKQ
jgi:hypothetical protein